MARESAAASGRARISDLGRVLALSNPVVREIVTFVAILVICAALIAAGGYIVVQKDAEDEAARLAIQVATVIGRDVIQPNVGPVAAGAGPSALDAMDQAVRKRILDANFVRVKIWNSDGVIIYSDQPALIGKRFQFDAQQQSVFSSGKAAASAANLNEPQNQYERSFGKLLQIDQLIPVENSTAVMFELDQEYSSVSAYQYLVWQSFLPIYAAGFAIFLMVQVPMTARLAGRLRQSMRDRELLANRALDASEEERKRIARDLHDGVVQDISAASYSLTALSRSLRRGTVPWKTNEEGADTLDETGQALTKSAHDLRTLLVEIAPPVLQEQGLTAAIRGRLEAMENHGIKTTLTAENLELPRETEELVFRAVQELLRNVEKHAEASKVDVSMDMIGDRLSVVVKDDGRGVDVRAAREKPRHFGLRLLGDLIRNAGGSLLVNPDPAGGTRAVLEIPV